MLSSKQVEELQRMVTPNKDNAVEEDDVRALIYRESQLRKKAAAAKASEKKQPSTASVHHRTSTRKRSPIDIKKPLLTPQLKNTTKRKRDSPLEENSQRKRVPKKQYRKKCSAVCIRHGQRRSYAAVMDAQSISLREVCV